MPKVARDGQVNGEFQIEDLNSLLASGTIRTTDDYWMPGMEKWKRISELVEELDLRKRQQLVRRLKFAAFGVFLAGAVTAAIITVYNAKQEQSLRSQAEHAAAQSAEAAGIKLTEKEDLEIMSLFDKAKTAASEIERSSFTELYQKRYQDRPEPEKLLFHNIFKDKDVGWTPAFDSKVLSKEGGMIFDKRAWLIPFVTKKGELQLSCFYFGDNWLFMESVESDNSKGYFSTPNAKHENISRKQEDGAVSEQMSFVPDASNKFFRSLIKSKSPNPRIGFRDKNGEVVCFMNIGSSYFSAIKKSVELADAFIEVERLRPRALIALTRKANAGDKDAQFRLSYESEDKAEQLKWEMAAAKQNHTTAMRNRAYHIQDTDPKLAEELNRRADEVDALAKAASQASQTPKK